MKTKNVVKKLFVLENEVLEYKCSPIFGAKKSRNSK